MSFATIDTEHGRPTAGTEPDLAAVLANGGWLRPITVPDLVLPAGEEAYADLWASGWRFEAAVVPYERRTIVVGGPMMALATGLASITGNRRRQREAEAASAPQWRPLGTIRVVVTSHRLLVLHAGAWWSVCYSEVVGVELTVDGRSVNLMFRVDPPYRLDVAGVSEVAAVLAHFTRCPLPAT